MSQDRWNDQELLREAKAKAQKLMASLIEQSQDLDRFVGQMAPEKLAEGQQAFEHAIRSARRALQQIDLALQSNGPRAEEGL